MMNQKTSECSICMGPWVQQTHPRRGPREQCGKCGNLRTRPGTGPPEKPDVESLAATMEMYTAGIAISEMEKVCGELELPGPNRKQAPRQIDQFARMLRDQNPTPRAGADGEWSIVRVYMDSKNGGQEITAVYDNSSQMIIAAGIDPMGDMPVSVLRIALLRAKGPPRRVTTNILGISMNQVVEEQIKQSHSLRRETLEDITRGTRLQEFVRVLEARKKFQGRPSQDFLENILEILTQDLNFMRAISPLNNISPGEAALMEPPYRNWTQAANDLIERNIHLNSSAAQRAAAARGGLEIGQSGQPVTDEPVTEGQVQGDYLENPAQDEPAQDDRAQESQAPREEPDATPAVSLKDRKIPGNNMNHALLEELQSFIENSERDRDQLRQRMRQLDEDAEAAWKLCASLEDGVSRE